LEGKGDFSTQSNEVRRVELEKHANLVVLFRIQNRQIDKIRTFSDDCELDAGGLAVYWFTDVRPQQSVELLSSIVELQNPQSAIRNPQSTEIRNPKLAEPAVAAIAFHADPAADTALERFIAPNQPEELRKRVAFWLGVARGRRGYEVLRRLVHEDSSDKVREASIFALSQSKEAGAVATIIEIARNDKSSHVRGQALFWLGQKAGTKAASAITEAIENDPDTDVKKRAVFALSQLPKDEGIPKLIEVAKTNRNPAVRKQAIFWLGQSKDPRALSFFEEILTK
jgi:HEAT repeat protein